jgi:hypothetical protein
MGEPPYSVYVKTALDQVAEGNGTERETVLADEVVRLTALVERAEAALRGVSNAYGCFAGCTGGMPDAPPGSHTPACREARAALSRREARDE